MIKCKYFGKCGGCSLQHLSYESQLEYKKAILKDLFGFSVDIIPNPKPFHYRSRMDFVYAFGKIGLRKKGSWKKVVDIDYCYLMSERANKLLKKIREAVKQYNIEDYDYIKHKGFIRYFVIRETQQEIMLNIVVAKYTDHEKTTLKPFIDVLLPEVDSLNILLNDTKSDVSFGKLVDTYKKPYIIEHYNNIKLKVYPNSFLQSNREITSLLYKEISKFCKGTCIDLYSGIGSIALYILKNSSSVNFIEAVELVEENVRAFEENIVLNDISRHKIKIYLEDVKKYLTKKLHHIKEKKENIDVIISDPPRSGMGKKVCEKLLKLEPETLILVSCNPKTLKQDLDILKTQYNIEKALCFDMFSQTPHIECLFVLKKKKN